MQFEGEDIVDAAVLFEAVGCGLGKHESYRVAMAAHRLGESPSRGVAKVRFFGKIFGTHADYYVFETTLKDPPEAPTAPGWLWVVGWGKSIRTHLDTDYSSID